MDVLYQSITKNALINRTHKKALRVLYKNNEFDLSELINLDSSTTIHVKNIQTS